MGTIWILSIQLLLSILLFSQVKKKTLKKTPLMDICQIFKGFNAVFCLIQLSMSLSNQSHHAWKKRKPCEVLQVGKSRAQSVKINCCCVRESNWRLTVAWESPARHNQTESASSLNLYWTAGLVSSFAVLDYQPLWPISWEKPCIC